MDNRHIFDSRQLLITDNYSNGRKETSDLCPYVPLFNNFAI